MANSGPPNPSSVEIRGATKSYGRSKIALHNFSMAIEPGSFTVLLGPSGSGKTTLLRAIAGVETISSGSITISGTTVASRSFTLAPDKRNLAMVFQDFALWPHLRVWENVAYPLRRTKYSKSNLRNEALEMCERVGMASMADRYPNELSGGEQQRVALGRALVGQVGLILFDEPLSNLDADLREKMRLEIATLTRSSGATCIYITHDQSEAFALADQIGVMRAGQLLQCGLPEDLYHRPTSPFVTRFTGISGTIRGQIIAISASGIAEVETTSHTRTTIMGRIMNPQDISAMAPVEMLIRPAAIRVTDLNSNPGQLRAVVKDVAFRGRGYELALELESGEILNSVYSPQRLRRGSSVGLSLDSEGTLVFAMAQKNNSDQEYTSRTDLAEELAS